jgi:hypothetical protein
MLRRSLVLTGALTGALTGFALLSGGTASAATTKFHAALTGAAEVPPTPSAGTGEATVSLDTATHEITYDVTYAGLTGDATAGHIHGPAEPGKNAGVVVPFAAPKSPIHGTAKLTAEQEQQLTSGLYYVNIHTKTHPGGEIRGQLTAAK